MDGFREEEEMKKVYKKPVLYVEKLAVDKNFARSCSGAEPGSYTFGDENTCTWEAFFSHDGCGLKPETAPVEGWCYNGNQESAPFAS